MGTGTQRPICFSHREAGAAAGRSPSGLRDGVTRPPTPRWACSPRIGGTRLPTTPRPAHQRLQLLGVDEAKLRDEVVEVLIAGVDVCLGAQLRDAVEVVDVDVHEHAEEPRQDLLHHLQEVLGERRACRGGRGSSARTRPQLQARTPLCRTPGLGSPLLGSLTVPGGGAGRGGAGRGGAPADRAPGLQPPCGPAPAGRVPHPSPRPTPVWPAVDTPSRFRWLTGFCVCLSPVTFIFRNRTGEPIKTYLLAFDIFHLIHFSLSPAYVS